MTRWRIPCDDDDEVDEGADLHVMARARVATPEFEDEKSAKPKPFVKWVGGKRKLLPEILPRLPPFMNRYHEPFIGGGAVFFALAAADRIGHAFLSDANPELVETYAAVRDDVEDVIRLLSSMKYDKAEFLRRRAIDWRSKPDACMTAARFIYLNKCGFNGLYRVNSKGEFNVPFGKYDDPTICDAEGLRAASRALQIATIKYQNFSEALRGVQTGDAAYMDPPYLPLSATSSFTSYTSDGFSLKDHVHLRDEFRRISLLGAHVLLSNSAAPAISELYAEFGPEEVMMARAINSKGSKRGKIAELLVSSKSP